LIALKLAFLGIVTDYAGGQLSYRDSASFVEQGQSHGFATILVVLGRLVEQLGGLDRVARRALCLVT